VESVVNFANTPFRAAKIPDVSAMVCQENLSLAAILCVGWKVYVDGNQMN